MVAAPLYPSYLFVTFNPSIHRWRSIQSTVGVARLVCNGETPAAIDGAIIDGLRSRENEQGYIQLERRPQFAAGDKVRVREGVFCDCLGLFESLGDRERVAISLNSSAARCGAPGRGLCRRGVSRGGDLFVMSSGTSGLPEVREPGETFAPDSRKHLGSDNNWEKSLPILRFTERSRALANASSGCVVGGALRHQCLGGKRSCCSRTQNRIVLMVNDGDQLGIIGDNGARVSRTLLCVFV